MRKLRRGIYIILYLCYFAATIVKSEFWGDILSPMVTFIAFLVVYRAFFNKEDKKINRVTGLLLSLSILSWAVTDVLWAVCDLVLHINPENVDIISSGYSFTNIFLGISLTIYGYSVFRKWNMVQVFLDSVIMSFFVIELIWLIFLNEDIRNIMLLRGDWTSTVGVISDIIMIIWIFIWYMSVRSGKIPLFLRLMATGILLYTITDLAYFYQYFYSAYEPNSIIDAIYVMAFWIIAEAAVMRLDNGDTKTRVALYNTGHRGKGYALLLAPVILILFRGFDLPNLLLFVLVILIYIMMSNYVQNNIQKEMQLQKEQNLNRELELKVKARTEELEEKNQLLQHLLDQDFVTGLRNRRYLQSYLDKRIHELKEDETIVLLYIDINRFKMISTMCGHYIGDMILYEMAEKLKPMEKLSDQMLLTSYGDDTFIFAAVGKYDYKYGYELAQKAIRLCSEIYKIREYQIRVTVNIGISVYPYDSKTKEELIRHADIAMSQARREGFNNACEFDADLGKSIYRKNIIEIMLKKVNINTDFMVYYQPQLLTDNTKLIGFEALLRWKTQEGEMISPGEFIPVAEETGYILPIGNWVMSMAMKQIVEWNKRFHSNIMIGINVSLKQLNSMEFIEILKREIDKWELEPELVDLEITESLQLQENPEVLLMLENIRKLGVKISIDDFGTGYSSLSYLKDLPIDRIKLAKELVDYVHMDDFDYELIKAIILISKVKGIRVIAEGVETREQWETLKELQCDEVQGFYFGRPEPVDVIETKYESFLKED